MPLKIYLADLTHMGLGVATDAFPLNIGLISSYAQKVYGNEINVKLFKYPQELLDDLRNNPPDIIGFSNYTWNCNLSYYFTKIAKSINPEILTVWGGTNYPFEAENQEKFLRKRPHVDIHIYYEGELAFAKILERVISFSTTSKILESPIDGCQFISPADKTFVSGEKIPRIENLDSIPSPYTSGILDKFFDGTLFPMVETARGCPFACNFCNAGDSYFNNMNKFSNEYVREEFIYVAKRATKTGVFHAFLTDNNFGMIPRDEITSQLIHETQQKYGWPKTLGVCTGKNSKKRIISATRLLGKTLSMSMSVQSMDTKVLKNIKRNNIKLEDYQAIVDELSNEGRTQHAEIITPLPGETLDSYFSGFENLLDSKVSKVVSLTLTMLHGTPYVDDKEFIERNGYQTKYRLVPRDFSEIEGQRIFDVEGVGIATNEMSFEEYLETRKFLLIAELSHSSEIFKPLQRYLSQNNIKNSEWVRNLYGNRQSFPSSLGTVFKSYMHETKNELWDSEEQLVEFYSKPENYNLLLQGERGNNVLWRHRAWVIAELMEEWVNTVFKFTEQLLMSKLSAEHQLAAQKEISALRSFILNMVCDCFTNESLEKVLTQELEYNIPLWLSASPDQAISEFSFKNRQTVEFYFEEREKKILYDGFRRYGTDQVGLVKMMQRLAGSLPTRTAVVTEN